MIDEIRDMIKHYLEDHKKAVIVVGVLLVIALVFLNEIFFLPFFPVCWDNRLTFLPYCCTNSFIIF